MFNLFTIFLQSGFSFDSILKNLPLLAIPIVWYYLIIRPQSKARKSQGKFIEDLQKGEEVVTDSGIIGRVNKIEDDIITLQIEGKTFMRVLRSSLSESKTALIRKRTNGE